MEPSEVVAYCGHCGIRFEQGDALSVVVVSNIPQDGAQTIELPITVHRACSDKIHERSHEESLMDG